MKVAVIGLGRFGAALARQLSAAGAECLALDANGQRVDAIRDHVAVAVQLDATNEEELRSQGVDRVDHVVVAIGSSFEGAVLVTHLVKHRLGVKHVIGRATSADRAQILRIVGADETISPEDEAARETSRRIMRPALADYLKLTSSSSVLEVIVTEQLHGKTLKELDLRRVYGVHILGVKRAADAVRDDGSRAEDTIDVPSVDRPLALGERLIAHGNDDGLARFLRDAEKEG